ncbi:MAG: hydroxyacid dehydrogenase [Candidatus Saccharicenans sp.]|nr:hydroxyacid dehydrogenase [Candidatus Saccharicenans sp.]
MKNILVTFDLWKEGQEILEKGLGPLAKISYLKTATDRSLALKEANILFSWNTPQEIKEEEYPLLKTAEIMQLLSAGADHLPFSKLPETLKVVANVGAYAEPMAEHTLAMILCLLKRLLIEHQKIQQGIFDQLNENRKLKGLTAGILGFGGIGRAVARLLRPFEVKIMAINTSGRTSEPVEFVGTLKDLNYVLQNSDLVVVSLPLSNQTRGLIGEKELGEMKDNAVLINVSRGEIIEEKALFDHLKAHPKFMAGIDAWWIEPFRHGRFEMHYPFPALSNVICSPHNSGVVEDSLVEATKIAVENLKRYLQGGELRGLINREDYL